MIRIHFTATDFAAVRFSPRPAPLQELNVALMMMVRPDEELLFGRWRRRITRSLPVAVRPLRDLVPDRTAPGFIDVFSDTLEAAFDTLRDTHPDLVSSELERVYFGTKTIAPEWVRDLHQGRAKAWQPLIRAQRAAFDTIVRPVWPALQELHQREFTRHAVIVAQHGIGAALTALIPGTRLHGQVWELPGPDREITLNGRSLLLLPTFHWTGDPLISLLPGRPLVLTYPAGPGLPFSPSARGAATGLAEVLGQTRVDILLLLEREHTTSGLARRLRVSNATASSQAAALRGAGLITSIRAGRAVLHQRTALGSLLLSRHPETLG